MKYRRLGRTGLHVSVVGVGAWQFGGEWGKDYTQPEVDAVIGAARDHGINLIDTAECYGDHLSERLVGEAVKGEREQWVIATKFGHHYNDRFDRDYLWSASDVQVQLEDSLRALQTDYVDLYQFHSGGDDVFDNEELWTMLQKQVEAGKVRNLGISIANTISVHQAESALKVGARALQVVYNRLDRQPEEAVFPAALRDDLGVLARVPLASGFLSGKYRPGATFDATDVRSRREREQVETALREVDAIRRTELPDGVEMAAWALAWCLRHPAVTCVIPGCKNPEQVSANAAAVELVADGHPQEVSG
ncbi:MAG: aldo/keto reductase [Spirochaetaceae bacterium]|nr:MAG: aldo/keto reductase [Spirochaetaceae bacterium]